MCDGEVDCGYSDKYKLTDGSDEDAESCKCRASPQYRIFNVSHMTCVLAGKNRKICPPNQSVCSNGKCLDIEKFCDSSWDDCGNDEVNCTNESAACSDLRCSYNCKLTPDGPKCYCGAGQQPNGTQCVDFDECTAEGACDQLCQNTVGSFRCYCAAGYAKVEGRCRAVDVPDGSRPVLELLTIHDVRRIDISTTADNESSNVKISSSETVMVVENPVTLEMWHRNQSVCIVSINKNGSTEFNCHDFQKPNNRRRMPSPNIFTNMDTIDQIALDWISGNWYFLDDQKELIFVCNAQMEHCTVILENNVGKPRGMALDPTKGLIFYTKWGNSLASIDRAWLDGTNVTSIVTEKIVYPQGITLDLAMMQVYWVDTYMDNVERVNYDGSHRWSLKKKSHLMNVAQSLHSITVFEDTIYLASWKNQSVLAVNRFTSEAKIIEYGVHRGISLHVYHRQKQPDVAHPCRENNGGCQHLCIPMYRNKVAIAQCQCSSGYRSLGKTCTLIKEPSFLIYAKENPPMIKAIPMDSTPQIGGADNQSIVPITNIGWPVSFDFNVKDRVLYFGNNRMTSKSGETFSIESQKFDGSGRQVLVNGLATVSGLAFDWMGYNLFYTNSDSNSVSVLKLGNTTVRKELVSETFHPMSITLDPRSGYMYWSTWASLYQATGLIERAWFDGSHREMFVNASSKHLHWPTSLSIDFNENKLYWCDPVIPSIERINLDGTNRQLIYEGQQNQFYPMSAVHFDDYIYWTDNVKGGIMKLRMSDALMDASSDHFITLSDEKPLVYDMKVFNQSARLDVNVCSSNDTCPGLCLFTPEGAKCFCGDGYELNASGTKCIQIANYTDTKTCPKSKLSKLLFSIFFTLN